ncbi:hypothetical protein [Streptomyces sp. NPDC048489]|uniref:hypothetical protein n=1 Tax=Streptomyces sp. NPDC048489 TaxID=3154504 RepID=UPI003431A99E
MERSTRRQQVTATAPTATAIADRASEIAHTDPARPIVIHFPVLNCGRAGA